MTTKRQFQQFRVRLSNYWEAKQRSKGFQFWFYSAAAGLGGNAGMIGFRIYDLKDASKREKIMYSLHWKMDLLLYNQIRYVPQEPIMIAVKKDFSTWYTCAKVASERACFYSGALGLAGVLITSNKTARVGLALLGAGVAIGRTAFECISYDKDLLNQEEVANLKAAYEEVLKKETRVDIPN